MTTQLTDTDPKTKKAQIELIRKASIAKRISVMRSLSKSVILLSRRTIKRAKPNFNEKEVSLAFVSLHYGKDLAARLYI